MEKKLLFQTTYCEISHFPEAQCLYLDIIGSFNMAEYKTMFTKFMDLILEYKAKGLIADQRRSNGSNMEMRGWLVMTWMPELKKKVNNPAFKVAGINTEKYGFKKFIANYLQKGISMTTGMDAKAFENLESALEWIK